MCCGSGSRRSNYFEDVRFGFNILKQTAEGYRKIRNTLRYLLGAL